MTVQDDGGSPRSGDERHHHGIDRRCPALIRRTTRPSFRRKGSRSSLTVRLSRSSRRQDVGPSQSNLHHHEESKRRDSSRDPANRRLLCLNHLSRLDLALAELHRVGPALAASTFAPGWTHPAKDAVDETARSFGYHPPLWYTTLAPGTRAGDPDQLAAAASTAGFTHVQTSIVTVPIPLTTPADLAAWRLGLAHYAPFLRALDAQRRAEVHRAAEQAVAATGATAPLTVEMTVLTAS